MCVCVCVCVRVHVRVFLYSCELGIKQSIPEFLSPLCSLSIYPSTAYFVFITFFCLLCWTVGRDCLLPSSFQR